MNEKALLQRAIEIAENGIENGTGPFGAVISRNGQIIAEAVNRVILSSDPTAHAEILAIRKATEILRTHNLPDCTIYTSCEPCPMCLGAIYWAGIRKVVYASDKNDASASGFSDAHIYREIALDPSERIVEFVHFPDAGGERVFRKWDGYEKRIPY